VSVVTPLDARYGGAKGLDTDDHTGRLLDMTTDPTLSPPYNFLLPPSPNGRAWIVRLDSPLYRPMPVKSNWAFRTKRGDDGRFMDSAKLARLGKVPHGRAMFENEDVALGNSNIRLDVKCEGNKYQAAEAHGGTYSIDNIGWFFRVFTKPYLTNNEFHWNDNINVSGTKVYNWPGFSFMFHFTRYLRAEHMEIRRSHRDSLTLYMAHYRPSIRYNTILDGGDDCIALRQVDDFVRDKYGFNFVPPPIMAPFIYHNTLSEKRRMDLPQPPGDRQRSANCPINIAGRVRQPQVLANRVLYTYDGAEAGTIPRPAVNLDVEYNNAYPTGVRVRGLRVRNTRAPGVWVRDGRITGSLHESSIQNWEPFASTYEWSSPWVLPENWSRGNLSPKKVRTP
jgi:hypothetical protein